MIVSVLGPTSSITQRPLGYTSSFLPPRLAVHSWSFRNEMGLFNRLKSRRQSSTEHNDRPRPNPKIKRWNILASAFQFFHSVR